MDAASDPVPHLLAVNLHVFIPPAVQLRTLGRLHDAVRQGVAAGQTPVVEIDLDLCAVMPRHRTIRALARVADEFGIREWGKPEALPWLPGYSDEAWGVFLGGTQLPSRYPGCSWWIDGRLDRAPGTPFGRFHQLYWDVEGMAEDEPTPGLGRFVEEVEAAGGRVVFLSGRWLPDHVQPSRECLRRAGIPEPRLVIGNPWHESLVPPGAPRLGDAELKAWRQAEIVSRFGQPLAILDDRPANRAAVAGALRHPILSIAVAIPGFTCDPTTGGAPHRLSTFESFTTTIRTRPLRQHMARKYPSAGDGWDWAGEHAGLGKGGLPYVLPRMDLQPILFPQGRPPFEDWKGRASQAGPTEDVLLDAWSKTIPAGELDAITRAMADAKRLAADGLAAPWPAMANADNILRRSMICAWLHSRDVEVLMTAMGYPIAAAGVHDLRENVDAAEVRRLLLALDPHSQERVGRARYSPWLIRWAASLGDGPVNVGFLNPALLVDLCLWHPRRSGPEDAMDVHRLSDHHDGDGGERFDPIEAGINNLLHQREGRHGVRKEPVETWDQLALATATETGSEAMAKNSAARLALRDAIGLGRHLEAQGWLTPWGLVASPASLACEGEHGFRKPPARAL